jgi:hypothetical protein
MYRSIFYLFLFIFCLVGLNSTAQDLTKLATTPITDNFAGRPVAVNQYSKIKGSPYLYDDWLQGEVITNDGKVYKKMLIKFNAEKDELTFVYNKTDEPQKFADPIRMFTIHAERDRVFANQFPKIDAQNAASYYEVLLPGATMLLKRHKAVIQSGIDDVSRAVVAGVYTNQNIYYIYKDNQMQHLKTTRNGVLNLLADKAADVAAYADSQKINFEEEEDLKKLLNYYNTLK